MFWIVAVAIVAVAAAIGYWSDRRDRRAGRTVAVGDLREMRRDARAIGANPVTNSAMSMGWMRHRHSPAAESRDHGDTQHDDADR